MRSPMGTTRHRKLGKCGYHSKIIDLRVVTTKHVAPPGNRRWMNSLRGSEPVKSRAANMSTTPEQKAHITAKAAARWSAMKLTAATTHTTAAANSTPTARVYDTSRSRDTEGAVPDHSTSSGRTPSPAPSPASLAPAVMTALGLVVTPSPAAPLASLGVAPALSVAAAATGVGGVPGTWGTLDVVTSELELCAMLGVSSGFTTPASSDVLSVAARTAYGSPAAGTAPPSSPSPLATVLPSPPSRAGAGGIACSAAATRDRMPSELKGGGSRIIHAVSMALPAAAASSRRRTSSK